MSAKPTTMDHQAAMINTVELAILRRTKDNEFIGTATQQLDT